MATLPDELERAAPLLNLQPKEASAEILRILGSRFPRVPCVYAWTGSPFPSPHLSQAGSGSRSGPVQAVLSSTRLSKTLCHHPCTMSEGQMSVQKAPDCAFHVAGLLSRIPPSLSSGTLGKSFVEAVFLWKLLIPQAEGEEQRLYGPY